MSTDTTPVELTVPIQLSPIGDDMFEYDLLTVMWSPRHVMVPVILVGNKFRFTKRKPKWPSTTAVYDQSAFDVVWKNNFNKFVYNGRSTDSRVSNTTCVEGEPIAMCLVSLKLSAMVIQRVTINEMTLTIHLVPGIAPEIAETESTKRIINKQDLLTWFDETYPGATLQSMRIEYSWFERRTYKSSCKCYVIPQSIYYDYIPAPPPDIDPDTLREHTVKITLTDLRTMFPDASQIATYQGQQAIANRNGVRTVDVCTKSRTSKQGWPYFPDAAIDTDDNIPFMPPPLTDADLLYAAHMSRK